MTPEAKRQGYITREFTDYDQNIQTIKTEPKEIEIEAQVSVDKKDMKFVMPKNSVIFNNTIEKIYYTESPIFENLDQDSQLQTRNEEKMARFNEIRNKIEKNEKYQESFYHVMKYFQHKFKKTLIPNDLKVSSPIETSLDQGIYMKE